MATDLMAIPVRTASQAARVIRIGLPITNSATTPGDPAAERVAGLRDRPGAVEWLLDGEIQRTGTMRPVLPSDLGLEKQEAGLSD